ncbi:hypothetical protein M3221_05535 [Domibacillus indicus]|uniref:hypothetical protein n=1 Tax=Domibacillus indicus TaxID=1437523 RepID=UPI00203C0E30|nr:hypothetical protein [Domibacillus indicus]MCM3787880.1 hypothetical protein [Domibacillus indicus]
MYDGSILYVRFEFIRKQAGGRAENGENVEALLQEAAVKIAERVDGILSAPAWDIRFVDLRSRSMDFLVEIPITSFEIKEQVESRLRHSIVQLFMKNDITLASPIVDSALFE